MANILDSTRGLIEYSRGIFEVSRGALDAISDAALSTFDAIGNRIVNFGKDTASALGMNAVANLFGNDEPVLVAHANVSALSAPEFSPLLNEHIKAAVTSVHKNTTSLFADNPMQDVSAANYMQLPTPQGLPAAALTQGRQSGFSIE